MIQTDKGGKTLSSPQKKVFSGWPIVIPAQAGIYLVVLFGILQYFVCIPESAAAVPEERELVRMDGTQAAMQRAFPIMETTLLLKLDPDAETIRRIETRSGLDWDKTKVRVKKVLDQRHVAGFVVITQGTRGSEPLKLFCAVDPLGRILDVTVMEAPQDYRYSLWKDRFLRRVVGKTDFSKVELQADLRNYPDRGVEAVSAHTHFCLAVVEVLGLTTAPGGTAGLNREQVPR
ncbi:MAG: hypothetical protein JW937_06335 [Candidatus Omnitrophica bacterium]|nr:hypothetical protein [Candidatus Omnitrophota bacterium]